MPVIRMRRVSRQFDRHWAVRDVDFEVEAGETVALIGPSGSGKTTLLRLVNRLVERTSGTIEVLGQEVNARAPAELRRQIGYVIQDVGLFPHYTVPKNIAVVPELLGWERSRIRKRTAELLERVGLPPAEYENRYPHQLSGGQRQRIGFARALAADPPLVLFDEPFGALDPVTRETLQNEFVALAHELQKTFVIVTHDIVEAARIARRIVVFDRGGIIEDASPRALVRKTEHPLVEALLGAQRYQLTLMTTELASVRNARETPSSGAIEMPATASVWDALARLHEAGEKAVRIRDTGGERVLSREQLLESADES